jgi:hypothetical protein
MRAFLIALALGLAVLAGMLAKPVNAQDRAFWDATGCSIAPVTGEAWVAEVWCINELTTMTGADVSADLRIDGLTVHLSIAQTPGRIPDTFTVTPPDGFVAEPADLVLGEELTGVVRVYPYVGF